MGLPRANSIDEHVGPMFEQTLDRRYVTGVFLGDLFAVGQEFDEAVSPLGATHL